MREVLGVKRTGIEYCSEDAWGRGWVCVAGWWSRYQVSKSFWVDVLGRRWEDEIDDVDCRRWIFVEVRDCRLGF